jgi:hypothetical protein
VPIIDVEEFAVGYPRAAERALEYAPRLDRQTRGHKDD